METNINYTVVGAFVVILITAIVVSTIWLSSGLSFVHHTYYKIYMTESVSGLNIDSPVEYNGVQVGSVQEIGLTRNDPQIVKLVLSIDSKTPITRGTYATLSTRGVTGITFIALKDKGTDLRPIEKPANRKYPVIKTYPSIFIRLDSALTEATYNLSRVAEAFQNVFNKENQKSIKEILINIQEVTKALSENNVKLTEILTNTAKASQQLNPLLQSSATALKIIETQTLPSTYRIISNLDDLTRNLSEVTLEIKQNPSILIRGIQAQPLGPGEK